ncbi:MAG: hypothetical protein WCK90_01100 [archaeon]
MVRESWEVGHNRETYSLFMGIIALIASLTFFLIKFDVIQVSFVISDKDFLYIFASLTLLSAIVHFLATIDF